LQEMAHFFDAVMPDAIAKNIIDEMDEILANR
jgi:hypothetical protein